MNPISTLILTVVLIFHHARVQANDDVKQIVCNDLVALKIPENSSCKNCSCSAAAAQESNWSVVKTTLMALPYPVGYDTNKNTCSAVNYTPDCGAISFSREIGADGNSHTTETFAYNKSTKNIVHFTEIFKRVDPNFQIFQGELTAMEYLEEDGREIKESAMPEYLKKSQGQMFAAVAMGAEGKWVLTQTCDKKQAWLSIAVLKNGETPEQILKTHHDEIEAKLNTLGIDRNTIVDVPLSLPFSVCSNDASKAN